MSLISMIKFVFKNRPMMMLRLNKTIVEFYRASFISSALSQGLYKTLRDGPKSLEDIAKSLGLAPDDNGLEAWLEFGISLGELKKSSNGYALKGALSRQLTKPLNDTWQAFLQARVGLFYEYIIRTPEMLKAGTFPELDESYGELFARSSRTVEPIMLDVVNQVIPGKGRMNLLEVGCGSGIYIEQACKRNPELNVVGLELQTKVADFARANIRKWGIENRVLVESMDVRQYHGDDLFDLLTFYNLIYYFPLNERADLFKHMRGLLKPGGRLILTTLCRSLEPSISSMNLLYSMTNGCGPLPEQDQLKGQLTSAGFEIIDTKRLMPGFWFFTAYNPASETGNTS